MVELGRNFRGSAPRGYIAQPAGFNDPLVLGDADVMQVAGEVGGELGAVVRLIALDGHGPATLTAEAVVGVKPILNGIVIEGVRSRAFLQDPSVKRVTSYSVGDPAAGGKLQRIADDRVVIARPEGLLELLRANGL